MAFTITFARKGVSEIITCALPTHPSSVMSFTVCFFMVKFEIQQVVIFYVSSAMVDVAAPANYPALFLFIPNKPLLLPQEMQNA